MNRRGVLNIGLFGFGTVGRGLYDVLKETHLKEARIKRVCVRDINKERGVKADFTDNPDEILLYLFHCHSPTLTEPVLRQ